jgi:ribulose-phosphate 3-epimerase
MTAAESRLQTLPSDRLIAEFSLWSADLLNLATAIERTQHLADMYHLDACDGYIAPAFLLFPDLVRAIRRVTGLPLHVHLMASQTIIDAQIEQFAEAGADLITIHFADGVDIETALREVRRHGCRAGVALPLDRPIQAVQPYLDGVFMVTLLGTATGLKGQNLSPFAYARLEEIRAMLKSRCAHKHVLVAADGGVRQQTVAGLHAHGADAVVMGSLAFANDHLEETVRRIRQLPVPTWKTAENPRV